MAGSILIGLAWVWYTDRVKAENPFAATSLTSAALKTRNYETWAQRTSGDLWIGVVLHRTIPQIFGVGTAISGGSVAGGAAAAAPQSRRHAILMITTLIGFLLPFVLFTNLHFIHDYYQNSNALFVLAAVAIGLACIADHGQPLFALRACRKVRTMPLRPSSRWFE